MELEYKLIGADIRTEFTKLLNSHIAEGWEVSKIQHQSGTNSNTILLIKKTETIKG